MKTSVKTCLSAFAISLSLLSSCSTSQTVLPPSNPDRKFTTENNIPIHICAWIDHMSPVGYPNRVLPGGIYFVEVINDMANIMLPYIGQVYMPRYNSEGSSFKEPYTDLKVERNKKNNASIMTFKTSHDNIVYTVNMELWDGGPVDITLTPNNAQSCHYSGTWDEKQLYDKEGNPLTKKYY